MPNVISRTVGCTAINSLSKCIIIILHFVNSFMQFTMISSVSVPTQAGTSSPALGSCSATTRGRGGVTWPGCRRLELPVVSHASTVVLLYTLSALLLLSWLTSNMLQNHISCNQVCLTLFSSE